MSSRGSEECSGWAMADVARIPSRPSLTPVIISVCGSFSVWVPSFRKCCHCDSLWKTALGFLALSAREERPTGLEVSLSLSDAEPVNGGTGGCRYCFHASSGDNFKYILYCRTPCTGSGELFLTPSSSSPCITHWEHSYSKSLQKIFISGSASGQPDLRQIPGTY